MIFADLWTCISTLEQVIRACWVWWCQHTIPNKDKRSKQVSDDSFSPRLLAEIWFSGALQTCQCSSQLLASKMWTSCCLYNTLESHDCDLNSDIYDFQPILKPQTVLWSKTLTIDLNICWNISMLQTLTWDSTALQEPPPMGHLWNSWGERLPLWQCRLIWGSLFTPKAKHPRAEWWACLATPTRLPRILAGRQRTQDQGSPLHKYRRGRGSSGELIQGFHPREAHFRGMRLFPHLDRSPAWALCGCAEPWIDRHVPSDPFVLFWSCISVHIPSPGPDTAVGRSGWVSTHMVFCYKPNTY